MTPWVRCDPVAAPRPPLTTAPTPAVRCWPEVTPTARWTPLDSPATRGPLAVAGGYLTSGIRHILLGVDHLLFVLGLLLIVRDRWMLVKTISAFTVAHSITLAIATIGYASVPAAPLNAAIALSILFLGVEVVRSWRGETSLTIRQPWVVAFAFGLLHGFGFASGLTTMGLPRADIPLALLMFNVGVEAGQLAVIGAAFLLVGWQCANHAWYRSRIVVPVSTLIACTAVYWTIERLSL